MTHSLTPFAIPDSNKEDNPLYDPEAPVIDLASPPHGQVEIPFADEDSED